MTVSQLQKTSTISKRSNRSSESYKTYRIFDIFIRSQFSLPELPLWGGDDPDISVEVVMANDLDLEGFTNCHNWNTSEGLLICSCARRGSEYLLVFPNRVSFHIAPTGVISCLPVPGATDYLVRQLLLNQVLPCHLAHSGALLLHASAVTLSNGKTMAFMGASGHGKSTLAAFCHQQGAQIIDDDCVLLRFENQQIHIIGGVPTIRLLPDSLKALGHDPVAFVPYADHSEKQQKCLLAGTTPGSESRVLDRLFLIGGPEEAHADTVTIKPVGGQVAIMAILNGLFSLDPSDPDTMARTFSQAAALTKVPGIQIQHLSYPRDHAQLPKVLQALMGGGSRVDCAAGEPAL